MMLTNATITIYNHRYDSLTRFDTWHRTIIENVHVYVDHKASVGDSGLNSAEVYKIRIPTDVENAGSVSSAGRICEAGRSGRTLDHSDR